MTRSLMSIIFAPLYLVVGSQLAAAATVIQQYDFAGDLTDSLGGPPLEEFNTQTSEFSESGWSWTTKAGADGAPGAGLILKAALSDPENYSIGFRFSFADLGIVSGDYTKIVSFSGGGGQSADDNGLYFFTHNQNTILEFYPYSNDLADSATEFAANTFYDFFVTRAAADNGTVKVYTVSEGVQTLVFEVSDPNGASIPRDLGDGLYEFRLFMDDTYNGDEYARGGSVSVVKVWGDSLSESEVDGALDPDSDGDGVSDDADQCDNTPSTETANDSGCGPSQRDSDGDGVNDDQDAFPNDPTETADSDGDGIGDNKDAFPDDPTRSVMPVPVMPSLFLLLVAGLLGLLGVRRLKL